MRQERLSQVLEAHRWEIVSALLLSTCMLKHCQSSHQHWNFSPSLSFLITKVIWYPAKTPNKIRQTHKWSIIWTLGQTNWFQMLTLLLPGCVTLVELLNFPVLRFSPLSMPIGIAMGIKWILCRKHWEQCLGSVCNAQQHLLLSLGYLRSNRWGMKSWDCGARPPGFLIPAPPFPSIVCCSVLICKRGW